MRKSLVGGKVGLASDFRKVSKPMSRRVSFGYGGAGRRPRRRDEETDMPLAAYNSDDPVGTIGMLVLGALVATVVIVREKRKSK
ncbi:hypothetical protein [Streptomyces cyaneofuscatus]|uniref:hypothetical protein n=1 Tax=Streptomyces cyaneofuscatus TaxID=66883 RepID=UPI003660CC80